MRRFEFRLEKVETLRVEAEKTAIRTLGDRVRALRAEELSLRELLQGRAATLLQVAGVAARPSIDALVLARLHADIDSIDRRVRATQKRLADLRNAVAEAQEQVRVRRRDRKMLENLRAKAEKDHRMLVDQDDARDRDEIASVRHVKSRVDERSPV